MEGRILKLTNIIIEFGRLVIVYKSQGLTLKDVILDFQQNSKKAVPCGAFYTAITRVKSLKNVFLRNFDKSQIRTDPDVLQEIARLKTVPYQFIKPYLSDKIFNNCNKELKISYLNTNGLLHTLKDIQADFNLLRSDILCLSESKIGNNIPNESLKIENFEICCRLNSDSDKSGGMIVYVNSDSDCKINLVEKRYQKYKETFLEQITLTDRNIKITFVYFHPSLSRSSAEELRRVTSGFDDSTGMVHFRTKKVVRM